MENLIPVLVFLVALILGVAATYWFTRNQIETVQKTLQTQLEEAKAKENSLQSQINQLLPLEGEVKSLREQHTRSIEELLHQQEHQRAVQSERENLTVRLKELETSIAERESALERERIRFQEEQKALEDAFANLSKQALSAAQNSFMELANEKFKDARQVSQQEIDKIVAPMKQTLDQLQSHTKELEEKRVTSYSTLSEQVRSLLETTSTLSNALKRPEVRGSWGELGMRRVAESAGLIEGKDYVIQESTTTESGRLRPDMIVNLPNGRRIIVDAKVPWHAYQEACSTNDPKLREEKLKDHARQLKKHVTDLSGKQYFEVEAGSPEFVVLFIPNEALYQAALQEDFTLAEYALDRKVVLANPMTLIALLRTVANQLQQQSAYENAQRIAQMGGELIDAVAKFAEHYVSLGKNLNSAVDAYDKSVGSLEKNILPKAKRMQGLGTKNFKELPAIKPVDRTTRELTKVSPLPSLPELNSSENDQEELWTESEED